VPQYSDSTFARYSGIWLIGTGIFELLLAAGFVAGGIASKDARGGLFLTAAILGAVGIPLVWVGIRSRRKAKRVDRIEQSGVAGQATITGMTQTGMYLNNNPQIKLDLQVTVPGRAPYPSEHKSFIPLMMLGQIQPGASFPVKVDPADPQNVVIEWGGGGEAAAWPAAQGAWPAAQQRAWPGIPAPGGASSGVAFQPPAPGGGMGTGAAASGTPALGAVTAEQVLGSAGVAGSATVDSIQDSGMAVGDTKVLSVTMTVTAPGVAPHQVTHVAMVPTAAAAKVRQGMTVPVRVAPENPGLVHVDWSSI
jgi:hypothetical protein